MATIVERNGRFLARVRVQGFKAVSKTFHRRSDATAWGKRVEADMQAGRWTTDETKAPTLSYAISIYKVRIASNLKGATTYAYWLDELAASLLGPKTLDAISGADLSAWRDQMSTFLKPGTVARKLGMASGLFTWAQKDCGWIGSNPLHGIRKPKVNDSRDRIVSAEEMTYIQEAACTSKAAWLADTLILLQTSAMRRGEVWSLQRDDVAFDKSTAYLAGTKNGSAREVPLCPRALSALRRLDKQAEQNRTSALVPVASAHAISLAFRRTLIRARNHYERDCKHEGREASVAFLANLRLHDFRHHAVSTWASTGALSVVELMSISGHKSPRMLTRYAHLSASAIACKLAGLKDSAIPS